MMLPNLLPQGIQILLTCQLKTRVSRALQFIWTECDMDLLAARRDIEPSPLTVS